MTTYTEHRYPLEGSESAPPPRVEYGNTLKALAIVLSMEGIVALQRISDFFREVTGGLAAPCRATIEHTLEDFAEQLPPELEKIKKTLLNGKVLHVNETPLRTTEKSYGGENGEIPQLKSSKHTTQSAYLRVYSNDKAALFTVNPRKDGASVKEDGVLPQFHGVVSHDHESKFYGYGTGDATCGAHLLRELKGLRDLFGSDWAGQFSEFYMGMNERKNADLAQGVKACGEQQLREYAAEYDVLLERGKKVLEAKGEKMFGGDELRCMLNRLSKYKTAYMMFMNHYEAPFTNNQAERDLRPSKTKRKVSGCFRSWRGIETFAAISSYFSTLKKSSLNLFNSVLSSLQLYPTVL